MRVRADREHARPNDAALGQDNVLNPHAPLLVVVQDVMFARKIAHDLRQLGGLDVLRRLKMVGNQRDLRPIKDRASRLFKLLDGRGTRHIVCEHHVELADNQLPRLHMVKPRMACENLLAHVHAHIALLKLRYGNHSLPCSYVNSSKASGLVFRLALRGILVEQTGKSSPLKKEVSPRGKTSFS